MVWTNAIEAASLPQTLASSATVAKLLIADSDGGRMNHSSSAAGGNLLIALLCLTFFATLAAIAVIICAWKQRPVKQDDRLQQLQQHKVHERLMQIAQNDARRSKKSA